MSSFPCVVRTVTGAGEVRYALGHRLVDRYLEFVAGRCRPNTLRAVAFGLKAFFAVVAKDPVQVTAADVFDFLAEQRGDRSVVRLADRESGLAARTIARRLSSVSGLYAYLIARGDTPVQVSPVPRGLATRVGSITLSSSLTCSVTAGPLAVMRPVRTGGSARRGPCDAVVAPSPGRWPGQ
jgi:integrase/recombinase XerD